MTGPTANSQNPDPTHALKIASDADKIMDIARAIIVVADKIEDDADELYALARKIWNDAERIRDLGFKLWGRFSIS